MTEVFLKSSILYIFWGRKNLKMDLSNLCSNADVRKTFCLFFSPVVKVHQVVSCAAAIFKKQVVLGLVCTVFLFTSSSDSEALMYLS